MNDSELYNYVLEMCNNDKEEMGKTLDYMYDRLNNKEEREEV